MKRILALPRKTGKCHSDEQRGGILALAACENATLRPSAPYGRNDIFLAKVGRARILYFISLHFTIFLFQLLISQYVVI